MDIAAALKYPMRDSDWKGKLLKGFLILLIPIAGVIIWTGYVIKIIQEVSAGYDYELPEWDDLGSNFQLGLPPFVALIVYMVPALFIGLIGSGSESGFAVFLILVYALVAAIAFIVGSLRYASSEELGNYFALGENFSLLSKYFSEMASTFVVLAGGLVAVWLLGLIPCVGIFAFLLGLVYLPLCYGYALGRLLPQLGLESKGVTIVPEPQPEPLPVQEKALPAGNQSSTISSVPSQSNPSQPRLQHNLKDAKVFEISLPRGAVWVPETAKHFIDHILEIFSARVVFRILAEPEQIKWQILDCFTLWEDPGVVARSIRSLYPEAEVTIADYQAPDLQEPIARMVFPIQLGVKAFAPIKLAHDVDKTTDPLATLTQSMSGLAEGERFVYTVCVDGMIDPRTRKSLINQVKKSEGLNIALNLTDAVLSQGKSTWTPVQGTGRTGKGKYENEAQKAYDHKLYDQRLYNAYIALQFDIVVPAESSRFTPALDSATILQNQFASDFNWLEPYFDEKKEEDYYFEVETAAQERRTSTTALIGRFIDQADIRWRNMQMVLGNEELAALWHLPHEGFNTPEVTWLSTSRAPETLLTNREGVVIGTNTIGGEEYPVHLHPEDRATHMNIVGRTGVGKSTFMHNLIHQDIASGKGVGVVDPHGQLVSDILRISIPYDRIDDVVVIDISNEEHPPPLNPLLAPGDDESYTASEVVAILDAADDRGLPPRVADSLTAAFVTLRHEKTPTVRDVVKLFEDVEYRYQFLNKVDDVVTQEFWQRFESLSRSRQDDLSYPVIHRVRKFYRNPVVHRMMCHPDSLDLARLIREKKIVLVSLAADKRKVPDIEQRLVGSVFVTQMQMAGMLSLDNPTPFYFFVDEVQNFVTTSLNQVFEESRKYGFHLTVANQYLGQLGGKTLESIMGTVGASVVFQIGEKDVRPLAPYFRPQFGDDDLLNMNKYQAAVKARFKGNTLPAFSISTMPPPDDTSSQEAIEREEMVRQRSTELYTPKTKAEVQEWLDKRYPRAGFGPPTQSEDGNGKDGDWLVTN